MNKNLSKIVACALAIGAVSSSVPSTIAGSLGIKAAYASSYLDGLEVETSSGKELKLYDDDDCKSSHKIDDDDSIPSTVYVKLTSGTSKIKITKVDCGSGYELKSIEKGSKDYDEDDKISVSDGDTIKINIKDKNQGVIHTILFSLSLSRI